MPSAEKQSSDAFKHEGGALSEPKLAENAQKDLEQNNGEKSFSPIQQVIQIINNKVRNLEKRKVRRSGV
jgi:ferritin-like metal-binding protein YciE